MPINSERITILMQARKVTRLQKTVNAPKSRNNRNSSSVVPQTDQQFLKKTDATSRLKNHKTHGITSHGIIQDSRLTMVALHAKLIVHVCLSSHIFRITEFVIYLEQSCLFKEKRKSFLFFLKPL